MGECCTLSGRRSCMDSLYVKGPSLSHQAWLYPLPAPESVHVCPSESNRDFRDVWRHLPRFYFVLF
jgi:hypothetical protein